MATLAQNIQRAINDFNTIENAIVQKGVAVPDGTPTSEYGEKILSIETGVDTSGDTVVPSALREGYTAHNAAGQEITGAIPNYDGSITEGAVPGVQAKYEEGVADGKQAEYDAFWDSAFLGSSWICRFSGNAWTNDTFKPNVDIVPIGNSNSLFYNSRISVDLPVLLEQLGIVLDLSNVTLIGNGFNSSQFKRLGVLDLSGATSIDGLFGACFNLKTIDTLKCSGNLAFTNVFMYCTALVSLTIEGTIGQNGFNVSWSPLSKASLTSVVNALSSTTTGLTVTLRLAAVNTAFETSAGAADGSSSEEWLNLIATKSNWTINLINS